MQEAAIWREALRHSIAPICKQRTCFRPHPLHRPVPNHLARTALPALWRHRASTFRSAHLEEAPDNQGSTRRGCPLLK